MPKYIPEKGDFIFAVFEPQAGHEQKGRRPALVISNTLFNIRTGLAIVCPITKTDRGYPFHLPINESKVSGLVMVDQVKSIDYFSRKAKFFATASPDLVKDALELLAEIIK
jgi:mRNA interferase MazF